MRRDVQGERGVALALVLWLVVVLATVAAAVVATTRREATVLLNARTRTVARYAAESGIVAGVALLEHRMATAYTPRQQVLALTGGDREFGALRDVSLGSARFGVTLDNLNGRLDLNQADPETLAALFTEFVGPTAARRIVDALQDWRDPDDMARLHGAERVGYLREGARFVPSNAPLRRLDELRHVRGVTDSLAQAVAPYVTVSGDERIDVNAAPERVLAAVPGIGTAGARILVSRRRGGQLFLEVAEAQSLLGGLGAGRTELTAGRLAVAPSRLLLVSRGWLPTHPPTHQIEAAYVVVGQRLVLQSWREWDM
jgi:general secretion pathway protein K